EQYPSLPGNLLDALRALERNTTLTTLLGENFVESYLKLKYREWQEFHSQITPWEREYTLDC
ncbi:MAG: glutamine synthetase, partial [Gloeomargarita sp. SKYB31]|nr:glutamine synthetase [Gloeomargarita sp. SKYB31]